MRVEDYTVDDLEEVALAVTLRNDFDSSLHHFASNISKDIPSTDADFLTKFMEVLRRHDWFGSAAAMTVGDDQRVEILATTDCHHDVWNRMLNEFGEQQLADWIIRRRTVFRDLTDNSPQIANANQLLMVSHCFGSAKPISLLMTVSDITAIYRSLFQTAAVWVGAFLGITQRVHAQSQARAEAANAIAHLSASSIEMAQFRLQLARRELDQCVDGSTAPVTERLRELSEQIKLAVEDLKDAQRALQRGQYWSAEEPRFTEDVPLKEAFQNVVHTLNQAVRKRAGSIVSNSAVQKCCDLLGGLQINASPDRLRQSLRDATLGAWMLSGKNTLNVSCLPNPENNSASITFRGKTSNIPAEWSAQDLEERFFDPKIFCLTSQKPIVERALTFDLTRKLLEQMSARLIPAVKDQQFELTIDFQKCSPLATT